MKSYVIAVFNIEESVRSAQRCIESAQRYGINVELFEGITPADNPYEILNEKNIPSGGFSSKYSRLDNCISAFLSHHSLWEKCVEMNEEVLILEHDAIFVSPIPATIPYDKLISIGKPSYGKYNDPLRFGVNPLTSKPYLPGAHAYIVNPAGAKELINQAKKNASPTDIFINLNNFPWIQEYYPWPVEARDSFTTIQRTEGCIAKHGYGEGYRIL